MELRIRRLEVRVPPSAPRIGRSRPYSSRWPQARVLALRPVVSQFLTVLSDLVNLGERGLAALQVFLARVDVVFWVNAES
jgi:hypothetical protein